MREPGRLKLSIIGIAGFLLLGFAFWVSYKSTNGAPLRDEYKLNVAVPEVRRLAKNADVRIAGVRVGRVENVQPNASEGKTDTPNGIIKIALQPQLRKLPVDTSARLRPVSILGASFLELQRGNSNDLLDDGDTLLPAKEAEQVEITDLLDVFQPKTRVALQKTVTEFSNFFIGRGEGFGQALGALPETLKDVGQLSEILAGKRTDLGSFFQGLAGTASALQQSSDELSGFVVNGAQTFAALNAEAESVGNAIDQLQPTAEVAEIALTKLQPALDDFAKAADMLQPGVRKLPSASRILAKTLVDGTNATEALKSVNPKLGSAFKQVEKTAANSAFDGAIRKTTEASKALNNTLELLTPAQVHCNVISVWSQNFSTLAAFPEKGPPEANIEVSTLGSLYELFQNPTPGSNVGINTYPNANANECESGNEIHDGKSQLIGNPKGFQQNFTRPTRPPKNVQMLARKAGLIGFKETR